MGMLRIGRMNATAIVISGARAASSVGQSRAAVSEKRQQCRIDVEIFPAGFHLLQ